MEESLGAEEFVVPQGDPLAGEHADLAKWCDEAMERTGVLSYYKELPLKETPTGRMIADADPEHARRYIRAAVAQVPHWERVAQKAQEESSRTFGRSPGRDVFFQAWGNRTRLSTVINSLMRRKLPLDRDDFVPLLQLVQITSWPPSLGPIVKALERYASETTIDDELRRLLQQVAEQLRGSHDKATQRQATAFEQIARADDVPPELPEPTERLPTPAPAPAGSPLVLRRLKFEWGMLSDDEQPRSVVGPDQFELVAGSPAIEEHGLLSQLLEEGAEGRIIDSVDLNAFESGRQLLALPAERHSARFLAAAERFVDLLLFSRGGFTHAYWRLLSLAHECVVTLGTGSLAWTRDELFDVLLYLTAYSHGYESLGLQAIEPFLTEVERLASESPLTDGERYVLDRLRNSLIKGPILGRPSPEVNRLTQLVGDGARFYLVPGEVWSDQVNGESKDWNAEERKGWSALFSQLLTATSARPSKKWLDQGMKLVGELDEKSVSESLLRWLPLVPRGRTLRTADDTMADENATILRGLLWLIPQLERRDELVRLVTQVILSAYKKVPGVGPRAVKVGNAGVYALSEMVSELTVGQLAMLKLKVKFGTAQKEIEKAFTKAADALGLPRDEIEEMGVPTYGLEEVGRLTQTLGEYRAEIVVNGSDASLAWFDPKGKVLKSIPSKVQKEHAEEVKQLKQTLKDLKGMLPAQRDRIDGMYLLMKSWPVEKWRERYLDHPLVGTIARRLIWNVDGTSVLFVDGEAKDVAGATVEHGKTAEITLWHPVERDVEEVLAWRRRLETLAITQPFKQAHREVYVLTEAERNTDVYSNRFAAHVVKQHQFHALCGARGWKNQLRLLVDASYDPPMKTLPEWGLRAEFWVEGVGDDYGNDTNESGAFLYLATDQVRFYRTGAAENMAHASGGRYETRAAGPGTANINQLLSLSEIPPLVLSEVLRDVDLFVGVASVANNPNWQDGGPEGRYRDYWHNISFGELSATATTRKEVLERLVPRLAIADRCSFSDRFLRVEGTKRAYKIHLGSGNILMEPNDEYLCIVPDSRARTTKDDVFLPFEGDNTLSIILSKALLLAEDDKITDPTITAQIKRGSRS